MGAALPNIVQNAFESIKLTEPKDRKMFSEGFCSALALKSGQPGRECLNFDYCTYRHFCI